MGINLYSFYHTLPTPPPQPAMPANDATDMAPASLPLWNLVQQRPHRQEPRRTEGWKKGNTPTTDGEQSLNTVQATGSPPNLLFQDHELWDEYL